MEKRAILAIVLTLLSISMLTLAFDIQPVKAEPITIVSVYPPKSSAAPGETFYINITVTDVTDLYAWNIMICFDPTILNATSLVRGLFLEQAGPTTWQMWEVTYPDEPYGVINNTLGYVIVGDVFMPPLPPSGATGNGTLVRINFLVKTVGVTLLSFDEEQTKLRTVEGSTGKPIPHETVDGVFDNRVPPEHELEVSLTAPKQLPPGESTALNATVTNLGQNNETDVELSLLINDAVVSSVTIPELVTGASHDLSYFWTPAVEGLYNVTAYAPPVPGENFTANNVQTIFVQVKPTLKLLVINTPLPEDTGALDRLGYEYTLVAPTEFATVDLYQYNLLFVGWEPGDAVVRALLARASEIASWVAAGNGIVALSEHEEIDRWAWLPLGVDSSWGFHAETVRILNLAHPVMFNLTDLELSVWGTSYHGYFLSFDPDWEALAEGVEAGQPITLAATYGSGRIVITHQDPDWHTYWEYEPGAAKLLRNMIDWVWRATRYEHELAVSLKAPKFLPIGKSVALNATVYNFGLANETDVELQLYIDGEIVDSIVVPLLESGSFAQLTYHWTPTFEAVYNVTAYCPPVPGEEVTVDNGRTIFVIVLHPLIQPLEGQWANYTLTLTDKETNTSMILLLNATYSKYVSTYQMNVTLWMMDPWVGTTTSWLTLNIMNRRVEAGMWTDMWYPLWIETDVTIGSKVGILNTVGTVIGSRFVDVGGLPIDSWELEVPYYYDQQYIFLFDKVTGVVTEIVRESPYFIEHWELTATNILRLLQVEVNPETGTVGTQVTITGAEATPNGTLEIYWNSDFLGTTASDPFGDFSYAFTVPPTTRGMHHITIRDVTTSTSGIAFFTVASSISVTPTIGSIGATVQVTGFGFGAGEHVVLSFDDMRITEIVADEYGGFSATFSIPLSEAGSHSIKAWYDFNCVETPFTVVDVTPLEIQMDVGAIFFKGETAEFYVQTSLNGVPVDATSINITLHKPDGTIETLVAQRIGTGLYKIDCPIKGKGSMLGTYALVIEACCSSNTVSAVGTCLKTFMVKSPWRGWENEAPKVVFSAAAIAAFVALFIVWRREGQKTKSII